MRGPTMEHPRGGVGKQASKRASHGAAHSAAMYLETAVLIPRLVDANADFLRSQLPKGGAFFFDPGGQLIPAGVDARSSGGGGSNPFFLCMIFESPPPKKGVVQMKYAGLGSAFEW